MGWLARGILVCGASPGLSLSAPGGGVPGNLVDVNTGIKLSISWNCSHLGQATVIVVDCKMVSGVMELEHEV